VKGKKAALVTNFEGGDRGRHSWRSFIPLGGPALLKAPDSWVIPE
jgi:hypothetical protein